MALSPTSSRGGSTFNGGTITDALNIAKTPNAAGTPDLEIDSAHPGADFDYVMLVGNATVRILELDSDGSLYLTMRQDTSRLSVLNGGTPAFTVFNAAGTTKLGFFTKAGQGDVVAQPAHPVTLGDVIAALTALGLTA
jgi:hypothetical protein